MTKSEKEVKERDVTDLGHRGRMVRKTICEQWNITIPKSTRSSLPCVELEINVCVCVSACESSG